MKKKKMYMIIAAIALLFPAVLAAHGAREKGTDEGKARTQVRTENTVRNRENDYNFKDKENNRMTWEDTDNSIGDMDRDQNRDRTQDRDQDCSSDDGMDQEKTQDQDQDQVHDHTRDRDRNSSGTS